MGHFHVSVQVSHRAGGRFEPLNALVDTGATYTWIPRDVLEDLGIVPEDQWPFVLADGREVLYPVAWINIGMRGRVQPTIVVFGEPGSEPILGVVTLEEFRLAADPVNRQLISVPGRLKAALTPRCTGRFVSRPPRPRRAASRSGIGTDTGESGGVMLEPPACSGSPYDRRRHKARERAGTEHVRRGGTKAKPSHQ
jgi:clan AA aspartic protease